MKNPDPTILAELGGAAFRFTPRPVALPPDLRPLWRLSLLVLLFHRASRQGRASLKKLHVLNWALRQPESRATLLDVLRGRARPDRAIVRFDPALNRALDLAKGEKLVEQIAGDKFQITAKGRQLAEEVLKDPECMKTEKWFLDEVSSEITEARINRLLAAVA